MVAETRKALAQAFGVALAVAAASRFAEWLVHQVRPDGSDMLGNAMGMSIAGITAGLLFFLWRRQTRARLLLAAERERAVRHLHHHIRNSLQVIIYRTDDPLVREQAQRILKELEIALPRIVPAEDNAQAENR